MGPRSEAILFLVVLLLSCCKGDDRSGFGSGSYSRRISLNEAAVRNITLACEVTRFPKLCHDSITSSPGAVQAAAEPIEFVKLSMKLALEGVITSLNVAGSLEKDFSPPITSVLEDTTELLGYSRDLLDHSNSQDLLGNQSLNNVQHWLSAALTYNTDCLEFLQEFRSAVPELRDHINDVGVPLLSNALSVLVAFSSSIDDFRGWQRPSGSKVVSSYLQEWDQYLQENQVDVYDDSKAALLPSAVVSQNPDFGTHTSIQAAVNDAPSHLTHRYVIYIRGGIYDERVIIPSSKTMLMFVGDGINKTVITAGASTEMNITTYRTQTLAVMGNYFLARDLTVVNTAGPHTQAVAMRVDSDMAAFHRCSFWGYQDTLYTHAYRQFYRECSIYGTVDFIFGNAASVFQNCEIQVRPGLGDRTTSTITAQGRTDPAQDTAFVCQSCRVRGTPEYMEAFTRNPLNYDAYLGRPWKPYARAIFIESYLDVVINPTGWLAWNGTQGLETTMLGEFRNYGPGADSSGRVEWCKQLTTLSALQFTVRGLIQGGYWLPFTGIPFRLVF